MADLGRPILLTPSDIRKRFEAVQPPDDRTYSAEVTVIGRNLLHHRIARIDSLHALKYCTMFFPSCQALFQKNLQKRSIIFVEYGEFFFSRLFYPAASSVRLWRTQRKRTAERAVLLGNYFRMPSTRVRIRGIRLTASLVSPVPAAITRAASRYFHPADRAVWY